MVRLLWGASAAKGWRCVHYNKSFSWRKLVTSKRSNLLKLSVLFLIKSVMNVCEKDQENDSFLSCGSKWSDVCVCVCVTFPFCFLFPFFLPFLAVHISFPRLHALCSLMEQAQGMVSRRLKRTITQGSLDPKQSMTALQLCYHMAWLCVCVWERCLWCV